MDRTSPIAHANPVLREPTWAKSDATVATLSTLQWRRYGFNLKTEELDYCVAGGL
jgi:hypothetical protein